MGVTQPPVKLLGDKVLLLLTRPQQHGAQEKSLSESDTPIVAVFGFENGLVSTSEKGDFFNIQRSNCRLFLTVLALSMEPWLNQLRPEGPDGDKNADTFLVQA